MNIKSEKGSMILYVLIGMLTITAVAVGMFVTSANKQRMQLESINEMQKIYDNEETPAEAYQRYIGGEIIPIYTAEQFLEIGSGNTLTIDGKGYTFNEGCTYVLQNDITLTQNFTTIQIKIKNGDITLEGQGHTITVIIGQLSKIYTSDNNYQPIAEDYLVLMEHFDDNSNNYGITSDSGTLSTSVKKFGNSSKYYNNTQTQYASDANYSFTGDFTIDFWLNMDSSNVSKQWAPVLVVKTNGGIWIGTHNSKFVVRGYNQTDYVSINLPNTNTWTHIAICRKNNNIYVFYDGVLQDSVSNSNTFNQSTMHLGNDGGVQYALETYIDELRILNGYCQWTENFEVPINAYNY